MILQNLILILAVAIPAILLVLLRTNAAISFFALCAGALLVKFIGDDANLVGAAMGNNSPVVSQYAELVLLFLPMVLTAIVLRKTVPQTKVVFNVLAAIAVGAVGVVLAVPLLPGGVHATVTSLPGWGSVQNNQELVIAIGVAVSLVCLWVMQPRHGSKRKRH